VRVQTASIPYKAIKDVLLGTTTFTNYMAVQPVESGFVTAQKQNKLLYIYFKLAPATIVRSRAKERRPGLSIDRLEGKFVSYHICHCSFVVLGS
jgi:hypothetical protein